MRRAAARAVLARPAGAPAAASAACRGSCRRSPPRSARARRRARRRRPRAAARRASSSRSDALLERRQPRGPEQLVHPRAADAGDRALVAQQRVQVARLVEQPRELLRRTAPGRRPGRAWPPPRRPRRASAGSSLAQARCWVPNSRRRSSRPSSSRTSRREVRSRSEARLSQSCSRPADIRCTSTTSSPASIASIFPTRRTPGERAAGERVERRVERLHRDHAGRERGLDLGARGGARQAPRGDLDLGQLGHRAKSRLRRDEDLGGRRRAHRRGRRRGRGAPPARARAAPARRARRRRARRLGLGLRGRRPRRGRGPRRPGRGLLLDRHRRVDRREQGRAASAPRSARDAETARGARRWNDANVLALSLRTTSPALLEEILDGWFERRPERGRRRRGERPPRRRDRLGTPAGQRLALGVAHARHEQQREA